MMFLCTMQDCGLSNVTSIFIEDKISVNLRQRQSYCVGQFTLGSFESLFMQPQDFFTYVHQYRHRMAFLNKPDRFFESILQKLRGVTTDVLSQGLIGFPFCIERFKRGPNRQLSTRRGLFN